MSAATTVVDAPLEVQTLSALSKTALKVLAVKSISATAFLTTEGRDLRQIPRTVSEQQQPSRGLTFGQMSFIICLPNCEGVPVMTLEIALSKPSAFFRPSCLMMALLRSK